MVRMGRVCRSTLPCTSRLVAHGHSPTFRGARAWAASGLGNMAQVYWGDEASCDGRGTAPHDLGSSTECCAPSVCAVASSGIECVYGNMACHCTRGEACRSGPVTGTDANGASYCAPSLERLGNACGYKEASATYVETSFSSIAPYLSFRVVANLGGPCECPPLAETADGHPNGFPSTS